jgi:mannose-1-phosphate guanylyltransferase
MDASRLHAVVMAGGSGTRFWPASRNARPKQLLPQLGRGDGAEGFDDERASLLAQTVRRIGALVAPERTFIVTAAHLVASTARAVPQLPTANVLAEPAPRNTAPCIGWANDVIAARDPNALVAVLPSDHHVADEQGFHRALLAALGAAEHHELATVGIRPTRPDTGFGYIELGARIGDGPAHEVARFVEKPNHPRALEYVQSGRFLWNSGMFFFRASAMKAAIATHLPLLAEGLAALAKEPGALGTIFPTLPSISIDYGVVEPIAKAQHAGGRAPIAVVPGDFGWSDVGSWESAWELAPKDDADNALGPDDVAIDARGNLARATHGKTVALVGVNDLVVVETEDAILVMPRARAQDVRQVVDALKSRGRTDRL